MAAAPPATAFTVLTVFYESVGPQDVKTDKKLTDIREVPLRTFLFGEKFSSLYNKTLRFH